MYIVDGYPDGIIGWLDVTSPDVAASKAFYGGLFGWEFEELDDGEGNIIYHQGLLDGHRVAGMSDGGPMIPEGMPGFWTPYVIHRDVDGVVARAEAAGGTVLFPAMDVMDSGRMTLIQDPAGAVFGVWQPRTHSGAQVVNSFNSLIWNELYTGDVGAAGAFYTAVFGWSGKPSDDDSSYLTFEIDGRGHSAARSLTGGPVAGGPPAHWLTFFLVEDADAAVARAEALGATVVEGSYERSEWGARVVLMDPQGGVFALYESAYGAPEPPSM